MNNMSHYLSKKINTVYKHTEMPYTGLLSCKQIKIHKSEKQPASLSAHRSENFINVGIIMPDCHYPHHHQCKDDAVNTSKTGFDTENQ